MEIWAGAAALLGEDPASLETGEVFFVEGVECQLKYLDARGCALAVFELGDPEPGSELPLYRQLFEIQSMLVGQMDAVFVRDPVNESILFTVRLEIADEQTPVGFAAVLRALATQVLQWRDTVMRGEFIDYEALGERIMSESANAAGASA